MAKGNKTDFTFTYKQVAKSKEYLNNFDGVKGSQEVKDKVEVVSSKGCKTTYKLKGECQ